jgi:hypothetical protein
MAIIITTKEKELVRLVDEETGKVIEVAWCHKPTRSNTEMRLYIRADATIAIKRTKVEDDEIK